MEYKPPKDVKVEEKKNEQSEITYAAPQQTYTAEDVAKIIQQLKESEVPK